MPLLMSNSSGTTNKVPLNAMKNASIPILPLDLTSKKQSMPVPLNLGNTLMNKIGKMLKSKLKKIEFPDLSTVQIYKSKIFPEPHQVEFDLDPNELFKYSYNRKSIKSWKKAEKYEYGDDDYSMGLRKQIDFEEIEENFFYKGQVKKNTR